jgi:hypothetical protein
MVTAVGTEFFDFLFLSPDSGEQAERVQMKSEVATTERSANA